MNIVSYRAGAVFTHKRSSESAVNGRGEIVGVPLDIIADLKNFFLRELISQKEISGSSARYYKSGAGAKSSGNRNVNIVKGNVTVGNRLS